MHTVQFRLGRDRENEIVVEDQFLGGTDNEPLGVDGPGRPKTNPRMVLMPPTKNRSVNGIGLPFRPSAYPYRAWIENLGIEQAACI